MGRSLWFRGIGTRSFLVGWFIQPAASWVFTQRGAEVNLELCVVVWRTRRLSHLPAAAFGGVRRDYGVGGLGCNCYLFEVRKW